MTNRNPQENRPDVPASIIPEMVWLEGGFFMMGSHFGPRAVITLNESFAARLGSTRTTSACSHGNSPLVRAGT
ncbi:MAG: hypothetical protein AAFZ15_33110 [Bacteroidota bacterium]